jgi:hypothetical protein
MLSPYKIRNVDDAMDMIGHDYELIRLDCFEMFRQFSPCPLRY